MWSFRASSTFIMSDVQSIYIPSSIRDWYRQILSNRQTLWIPWTKTIRILIRSTWMHRVMHNTCIKHGRNIRTGILGRHQSCSEERIEERVERLPQQDRLITMCTDAGFENSWSRTVLHDKTRWRVLTIYRFSGLSWVHTAKRWKIIWPERLDSREHPNWTRVGSHSQLLQGKYGVEISIESVRQFSLVGQNFSWMKQVGHRPDRQRVRRQRTGNFWNEDRSVCFCKPIKG